jgi:hypothetical protein
MFILQTTIAVLIAFLAVIAYDQVRNRLAKGRLCRRDLETPPSPDTKPVPNDGKPFVDSDVLDVVEEQHNVKTAMNAEMEHQKQLYFKLHNLERYPDIVPECRTLLLSLLSSTLADALKEPSSEILSISEFSHESLNDFLESKDVDVTNKWEAYLARRKSGSPREMFSSLVEAKWWLKNAAPVKYVDGAWLGHINKISTPFKYRHITKNAWQVMSEELGDGDLVKNHVHVYRKLMEDIDAGLPAADSEDFIHSRHELNEARCWKAALAQLLISLFPHDFLPEVLGFNMAYESLPLHLLKTVKELRELRLNPYYFELHVSIDNADSGHAAMAMSAVANYIELVEQQDGKEAAHEAWRRVQAGYILAEGLPTTPESPSQKATQEVPFPRTDTEAALVQIFAAKSFVAHKIHCSSRLKIGRRSLVDWLEPKAFASPQWQRDFLQDLSNCRPWVVKGQSEKSRLVKELSWEGKMFGSFTEKEVEVVKAWIDELGLPSKTPQPDPNVYFDFTGRSKTVEDQPASEKLDILHDYPVLSQHGPAPTAAPSIYTFGKHRDPSMPLEPEEFMVGGDIAKILPLWFASLAVLESVPSVPVRASDTFGSAIIRVLRAQAGFDVEGQGVAGMDEVHRTDDGRAVGIVELGLEMCGNLGIDEPTSLRDVMATANAESVAFVKWMLCFSMRWLTHRDVLVGLAWAFMEMRATMAISPSADALWDKEGMRALQEVADRERRGLEVCQKEIEKDDERKREFDRGVGVGRQQIRGCLWWRPKS